jgi:hypothetical protein
MHGVSRSGQPSARGANAQAKGGSRDRSGRERGKWDGSRIDGRIDGIPDTMLMVQIPGASLLRETGVGGCALIVGVCR